MKKQRINNIASVGIIVRKANPSQIFIEVKDDGYPMKAFRRTLCPIGGNWIGEASRHDISPLYTFYRELKEELSLEKRTASTLELKLLGLTPEDNFYNTPRTEQIVTADERQILEDLKQIIIENCVPFGDYINAIPKKVLDQADPKNERDGFTALVSYWIIVLDEKYWRDLAILQDKFGNLSNESITIITTLEEIVETGVKTAFGHDRPLQQFFLCYGLEQAKSFPLVDGISSQEVGKPMASYQDYLIKYEVAKKPI